MSEKQIAKQIQKMEKQMHDYAKNLEFEKAAQTRDELAKLKERLFGVGGTNVIAIKAA
jgi:excinuclease ABC subunit B